MPTSSDCSRPTRKAPPRRRKTSIDYIASRFGKHLVVGNTSSSQKKATSTKSKKDPNNSVSGSNGNTPSGEVSAETAKILDDPEGHFFGKYEEMEPLARAYATAALSYLQKEKGQNLVFVKPLLHHVGQIVSGFRIHFNFQAKSADDPDAPVETYFGQLRDYGDPPFIVECCVSLGESDKLPRERDPRGCRYCTKFVHHPVGGCEGLIRNIPIWADGKYYLKII